MAAPSAHPADLALDAATALRADLAGPSPTAPLPNPPKPPPADEPAAASWLFLVTSLERAAQLSARARPAHFRRARVVWEDAAATLDEPRYATVAARLARWRSADPTLPLVKELLWAVEQPEAAGYTHLALAGYVALTRIVPSDDVRLGYILAQSARAARTLGDLHAARDRYEAGAQLGHKYRDRWLRVRSAVGLGATHHQTGNHPAARAVFRDILADGAPDVRFTAAAHHGLLLSANASGDHESALGHAWYLLRASRDGVMPKVEAWLLMAGVCARLARYRAATHLAQAALQHATRPDDIAVSLQLLVHTAASTADLALGRSHLPALRACIGNGAGAYDDVRCLLALAEFQRAAGKVDDAGRDLDRARRIAGELGLNELSFQADAMETAWQLAGRPAAENRGAVTAPEELTEQNKAIIDRLTSWDCSVGDSDAGAEQADPQWHATA